MADFLREVAAKHKGLSRNVAFAIPVSSCITRQMRVPIMTEKELALNLPYEFRDYISQGKDKYVYDYTVLSIEKNADEVPEGINLLAVAALKETLSDFSEMFRRAGFKLKRALPQIAALQNLMAKSELAAKNCCVIDFSHMSTQLHFFANGAYDVTRTIDIGGADLTKAVASQFSIDAHMAGEYKHSDFNSSNSIEGVRRIYDLIAVEAGRALNFYRFNNPEVNIEVAYYCGGSSSIPAFMGAVASHIDIPLVSIKYIMPSYSGDDDLRALCLLAVGATIG
jgi:type IV pilus assembly protein PilM